MTTVTRDEITQFRSVLADYPGGNDTLKVIEECQGNLEDAFEVLIVESESEEEGTRLGFGTSLEKLTQKCRNVICQEEFQDEIIDEFSREFLNILVPMVAAQLTLMGNLPVALSIPIVMFVIKQGIKNFCKSSDSRS